MPMIDVIAPEGIFSAANEAALLSRATAALIKAERIGGSALAVRNTGAYLHVLPAARVNAGGQPDKVVRVQILTPPGSLKQEQRAAITADITAIVGETAVNPAIAQRTWVLFHEAVDGGWGIAGTAYTNSAIAQAVLESLKRP